MEHDFEIILTKCSQFCRQRVKCQTLTFIDVLMDTKVMDTLTLQMVLCCISKQFQAFQYSRPCRVAVRCPMLDPEEGSQLPCFRQYRDIIIYVHAAVLNIPSK